MLSKIKSFYLAFRSTELYEALLQGITSLSQGNRPGLRSPRAVKRRSKPFPRLTELRYIARSRLVPTGVAVA